MFQSYTLMSLGICRAGQLYLHLYKKPMSFMAHLKDGQLKQLHSKGHDLYLTLR